MKQIPDLASSGDLRGFVKGRRWLRSCGGAVWYARPQGCPVILTVASENPNKVNYGSFKGFLKPPPLTGGSVT
jgi:hypothetical protein